MSDPSEREKQQIADIKKLLSETDDEPTQIDRIAEIRGWFRPLADSAAGRIPYSAMDEYAAGAADLETTVAKITKPIDDALAAGKDHVGLHDLWIGLFHSAKKIPFRQSERHQRFVDLIKTLKEHPEPNKNAENPVYAMLSGLSLAAREVYNDCPREESDSVVQEIHAWTNFNYFLACLTEDGVFTSWINVIWVMREALEKTPKPLPWWYDNHVPAAAVWVLALTKKIYEREEDLTPKDKKQGNPAKGGDLWTGGPVFSKERWAFWKRRFGEVAEYEGVNEETKEIAKEAVEAMEKVEQS